MEERHACQLTQFEPPLLSEMIFRFHLRSRNQPICPASGEIREHRSIWKKNETDRNDIKKGLLNDFGVPKGKKGKTWALRSGRADAGLTGAA